MNKTLYIRDEDGPTWDRARELAGEKLSPVIVTALKQFVADKEAEIQGMERIDISYLDSSKFLRKNVFYGRWLIPPSEVYRPGGGHDVYAVGVGGKGGIVLFQFKWSNSEIPTGGSVNTYPSLDSAVLSTSRAPNQLKAVFKEVQRRIHIPEIQELDV